MFEDKSALKIELLLSFDELVATLYGNLVSPDDLTAADDDLRELIAAVVACAGLWSIQEQATSILEDEAIGAIAAPKWLVQVRGRVREMLGQ